MHWGANTRGYVCPAYVSSAAGQAPLCFPECSRACFRGSEPGLQPDHHSHAWSWDSRTPWQWHSIHESLTLHSPLRPRCALPAGTRRSALGVGGQISTETGAAEASNASIPSDGRRPTISAVSLDPKTQSQPLQTRVLKPKHPSEKASLLTVPR